VYWLGCLDGGLHLTVSETGWAKSVWGKLYGQWLAGSAVMSYDFDKFVPADMLKILEKYKVTTFCAPPTIYRFMALEEVEKYDLSSLVRCSTAGEPLNPDLFDKWQKMTGHQLREIYGQTELCVTVGTFPWMKVCPGSMGKPSPLFDVDLVDEGRHTPARAASWAKSSSARARAGPVGMLPGLPPRPGAHPVRLARQRLPHAGPGVAGTSGATTTGTWAARMT
jgi:acetyl-CoA synthetase